MSRRSIVLTDAVYDYLLRASLREPPLLRRLREETAADPMARMQIAPEQGQFLALLVRLLGARRCLELGVYTGYSSLVVALALPPDARLVACDVSEEWTRVARRYWAQAGVEEKIEFRLGPALQTLDGLLAQGDGWSFDFAFIDADKGNLLAYYERALRLLRPGGLVAVDNTLWAGRLADPSEQSEDARALRAFNDFVLNDHRVSISMVPIGDGMTLLLKYPQP